MSGVAAVGQTLGARFIDQVAAAAADRAEAGKAEKGKAEKDKAEKETGQ